MLNLESVTEVTVDAVSLPETLDAADNGLAESLRRHATEMSGLLRRLETFVDEQHRHAQGAADIDEMQRLQDADPYRWIADAKHSLQAGIMFASRALAQPTGF